MMRTRPDFTAADHDGLDLRTLHALPTAAVCADCGEPATRTSRDGVARGAWCFDDIKEYWDKMGGME